MNEKSPGLGMGKTSGCKQCGSTSHFRSSRKNVHTTSPKLKHSFVKLKSAKRMKTMTHISTTTSVQRTIVLSLKQILLELELSNTIFFAVEQLTCTMKCLSEIMNAILIRAQVSDYYLVNYSFLSSIASAITTTYRQRSLPNLTYPSIGVY